MVTQVVYVFQVDREERMEARTKKTLWHSREIVESYTQRNRVSWQAGCMADKMQVNV